MSCLDFLNAFERSRLVQKNSVKYDDSLNAFPMYLALINIIAHDITEKKKRRKLRGRQHQTHQMRRKELICLRMIKTIENAQPQRNEREKLLMS